MTQTLQLPNHAIEFATKQVGRLRLLSWQCECGERGEWRAADVSRNEADSHLRRRAADAIAVELIAESPENVHRDAMTDEMFRRFNVLKRDLVHAALSRASARRQSARMLTLVAESDERLTMWVAEGDARMIAETEREKMERELSVTLARREEDESGRRLDAAAEALMTELERGR